MLTCFYSYWMKYNDINILKLQLFCKNNFLNMESLKLIRLREKLKRMKTFVKNISKNRYNSDAVR